MASRHKNITGADAVERAFRRMPAEAAKEVAAAINKGAEEIAATARILVPRRTGRTAASIKVMPIKEGKRGAGARIVAGTDKRTAITARALEFGRRPGPGRHPGHGKQPFMWPAYWRNRKRVQGRINRAIRKAVKRAMGNA